MANKKKDRLPWQIQARETRVLKMSSAILLHVECSKEKCCSTMYSANRLQIVVHDGLTGALRLMQPLLIPETPNRVILHIDLDAFYVSH